MSSLKFKNLCKAALNVMIIYLVLAVFCLVICQVGQYMINWFGSSADAEWGVIKIIFLYPGICCGVIYALMLIRILFFRDYANKRAIKESRKVNMNIPDKDRYKEVLKLDSSKILLRQFFVKKGPGDIQKTVVNSKYRKNYYLGNQKGELLFIVTNLGASYPDVTSRYSIIDPYNNDIGEIKVEEATLFHLREKWFISLTNGNNFQLEFDPFILSSRKEGGLKIEGLSFKFLNSFFDERHMINLNCELVDANTDDLVAMAYSSQTFGNADIDIYSSYYKLEIIVLYMCITMRKYEDGLNKKVIM